MNILIAGMTCSGKSTLADLIKEEKGNVTIMHEDDYMKDLNDIPHLRGYYLMDLPNSYYLDEFYSDSKALITDGTITYPTYDVRNNRRVSKDKVIRSNEINVFEGLHTIDALKDIPGTLKVFMAIPPSVCLERRIKRDTTLYGIREEDIQRYFNEVIMSIYKTHIERQRGLADVVIERESDITCLLKKL